MRSQLINYCIYGFETELQTVCVALGDLGLGWQTLAWHFLSLGFHSVLFLNS